MLTLDGKQLRMNSIIELCVPPGSKVHNKMLELGKQVSSPVFFDTIGNLRLKAKAEYILSGSAFLRALDSLRAARGFVLFIDSITFIADEAILDLQRIYSLLWELIYSNDATIVVSNHYKIAGGPSSPVLVPRLGLRWEMMVSYRLVYRHGSVHPETSCLGDAWQEPDGACSHRLHKNGEKPTPGSLVLSDPTTDDECSRS
jgi:hypothetical protein